MRRVFGSGRRGTTVVMAAAVLALATMAGVALAREAVFVKSFGVGKLGSPRGLAVKDNGRVYVANTGGDRISKFTADGDFVDSWGHQGSGRGEFKAPFDVALDNDGNVYVVDKGNDRIQKFDGDGDFIDAWGSRGSAENRFKDPTGLDVRRGNVWVADTNNDRIQIFTTHGVFRRTWGRSGHERGELFEPRDVVVNRNEGGPARVYVADALNHRIQKFDLDGDVLEVFGTGDPPDGVNYPVSIAVDRNDHVYVVDETTVRWVKFTAGGTFLKEWAAFGRGPGEFRTPSGIAVDDEGRVFVSDRELNRISKFRQD